MSTHWIFLVRKFCCSSDCSKVNLFHLSVHHAVRILLCFNDGIRYLPSLFVSPFILYLQSISLLNVIWTCMANILVFLERRIFVFTVVIIIVQLSPIELLLFVVDLEYRKATRWCLEMFFRWTISFVLSH